MQNVDIERVRATKGLGVFIYELLNCKAHIEYVLSKLSENTATTHKCSHLLDRNSTCMSYNALSALFKLLRGDYEETLTQQILTRPFYSRKRVIRIVFGARRLDHTNSFLKELHILNVQIS